MPADRLHEVLVAVLVGKMEGLPPAPFVEEGGEVYCVCVFCVCVCVRV